MIDATLTVIVPTRARPQNVARVVTAWHGSGAFNDGAGLLFVVDDDDPTLNDYLRVFEDAYVPGASMRMGIAPTWEPLVPKLNRAAVACSPYASAIGFAGDDHLPRTTGWAARYMSVLAELGTGIVHGNDGMRGAELPTEWAMTSDIVQELGGMVPAPVEHLFCDDAVRHLGIEAGCLRYLPDVLIEHMHPMFDKAPGDEQYARVNAPSQYNRDGLAFARWKAEELPGQAARVRALRA
jgi:hypothetical protein